MTNYQHNVFAPPNAAREAEIDRRLRSLEGRMSFDRQRARNTFVGNTLAPTTYTRLGLAQVQVEVPERARKVTLTGSVTFNITAVGSGVYVRYVQAAVMDVYRTDDLLYAPQTGASLTNPPVVLQTLELALGGLVQYEPEPGTHTYAVDIRSSVDGSPGTAATAYLTEATLAVEVG